MFLIPPNAKVNTFFEKKSQVVPMLLGFNGLSHEKYFCPMLLKKNKRFFLAFKDGSRMAQGSTQKPTPR